MITSTLTSQHDIQHLYDDCETFQRIRPRRETVMPVGKCRSQAKGRRRSNPPKRTHRAPSHCQGAALRHVRRWK